jgi:Tfp pilus assembly protein PilO
MKKLSLKMVIALSLVVIALVSAAGWFAFVSPAKSRAASLDDQIADARIQLATAKVTTQANAQGEVVPADYRVLAVAMPDAVNMPSAMRTLLKAARLASVRVDSVSTQPLTAKSGYDAVPIDVVLTGRFVGIKKFLFQLRKLAGTTGDKAHATGRLFSVDSLEFAPGEDELPQLTATVRLNAFVYNASAPTPSTETADPTTSTSATAAGRTS